MADIFIDPSRGTNGTGTFASPYNTWAGQAPVAGNRYLQKWGTTFAGAIGPTGSGGTVNNRVIIGVYEPVAGNWMDDVVGGAFVNATGQTYGIGIGLGRPYVTVAGFDIFGATSACILKESTGSSSSEAQYCWFDNCIIRDGLGAGVDMRGKGNRLRNCTIFGNASDGMFIVGDDVEVGWITAYENGLTNADGDCLQMRDSSNFYVHDSDLDHSASIYKQAFICTLLNVPGTTGGRLLNNRISCALYVNGVTAADQKTVQILTPGVKVRRNDIVGGQFGAYLEGANCEFSENVVTVPGVGDVIGVAIREDGIAVVGNVVVGPGLTGIDHSETGFTGVTIYNNGLIDWSRGIRTAASGALYSHNQFSGCTVRNSDAAGAEGTAGTGDVIGGFATSYRPTAETSGKHLKYGTDKSGCMRRNPPTIGAYEFIEPRTERT